MASGVPNLLPTLTHSMLKRFPLWAYAILLLCVCGAIAGALNTPRTQTQQSSSTLSQPANQEQISKPVPTSTTTSAPQTAQQPIADSAPAQSAVSQPKQQSQPA